MFHWAQAASVLTAQHGQATEKLLLRRWLRMPGLPVPELNPASPPGLGLVIAMSDVY